MSVGADGREQISKAELRLTDIADTLQGDWVVLARLLYITDEEITKIQMEYTYVSEQALVMLHLWVQKSGGKATGGRHSDCCNIGGGGGDSDYWNSHSCCSLSLASSTNFIV